MKRKVRVHRAALAAGVLMLALAAPEAAAPLAREAREARGPDAIAYGSVPDSRTGRRIAKLAAAISLSTTTTTTVPPPPTTTLPGAGTDVTGGGRFHGGFGRGSYDIYVFGLTSPAVLAVETSDGADHCQYDTEMDLLLNGLVLASDDNSGPGRCSRIVTKLSEPGEYEIRVSGDLGGAAPDYMLDVEFLEPVCGNVVLELLEECDDGNALDGDCCSAECKKEADGSPCNDGLLCDGDDTCANGTCSQHSLDPCGGADGDKDCSESCSDTGLGCTWPDPDGSPCNDGLFCNGPDRCVQGSCAVHQGNPCRGPDGDGDCTESCKESTDTCSAADPSGLVCDDGLFCNGDDVCSGGICAVHTGDPCTGVDGDGDCAESCSETGEHCHGPDPAGAPCTDGLFCTGADSCSGGTCSLHAGSGCPGLDNDADCAESCDEILHTCVAGDPDGAACNDGIFCNGPDTCSSGSCSVHAGNPCPGADGDGNCMESCNEAGLACNAADPAAAACNDGVFCNGTDTCSAGACGVHSGNPCAGPDADANCAESCNEAADTCTLSDPNGSPCNDGLFCTGTDACSGGTCSLHSGNTCPGADQDSNCAESCDEAVDACTAADSNGADCNDGIFCNGPDTCSSGSCSVHAGNPCPGADGDGNCMESCNEAGDTCNAADVNSAPCNDGVFCNGADSCLAGACGVHAGSPCAGPDGDTNCAESCSELADACTAADPNGSACSDGLFCTGADTCSGGVCSAHAGSGCTGADGDADCAESCDESADACSGADPNGTACNDGLFCNGADTCSGGMCAAHAGSPCPGADGDGNCAESCNEAGDTCNAADPDAASCNDGVFCNGADSCSAGGCSVHAGSPCAGPDGDGNCAESCNEVIDACSSADPDGSSCNDGLFCTGADSCSGGACSDHAGHPCAGADGDADCAESCNETADACTAADPNGAACNDGAFCNGIDTCSGGACTLHAGNPCAGADGDGNCSESCDEAFDLCSLADANGTPCNDAVFCNGADTCSSGACSVHAGDPCTGADGDGNCSETCNEAADNCASADADGTSCNDGLLCNGSDTCSGGHCILHAGTVCPGADGDGNCAESCSDSASGCSGADPVGSPCDDGIFCNGADQCSGGSCSLHAGTPCPGPDGDGNCAETCNEASDSCTAADPNGAACSDGTFCNGPDTCASGACSVHVGNPCPGPDGDANCAETCSEAADSCTQADPNGAWCSDGLFCNGSDSCSAGACTTHAGNPCAGPDGDPNCSESCSETADACSAADPNGTACNDNAFCNGGDSCSAGSCSIHTGSPCAGPDGDANCSESCNEAADNCAFADPDVAPCSDGLFCNGDDTCSSGACADHGNAPCPGADGDANCAESCNEVADACTATDPNGAACGDGLFCNGSDSCAAGACSEHAGNPCTGPDGDGNCAESCNETSDNCSAADPDVTACTDNVFCNGSDSCAGGSCSAHTGNPCQGSDADADCTESCNEAGDTCTASDPDGSACDDSEFCNGPDTCLSGSCSVHGGQPCTGADGDGNCAESCDETGDTCIGADADGSACNDGQPCTAGEECDGSGSCGGGEAVDCDDDNPCTTDSCINACFHLAIAGCTTTTTLPPAVCGDVGGNGSVTASDALQVLRAAVGGPQCDDKPCLCEVTGNQLLTASDALAVLRRAVGTLAALTCPC